MNRARKPESFETLQVFLRQQKNSGLFKILSVYFQKRIWITNFLSPNVYEYISECTDYNDAVEVLWTQSIHEVFARCLLERDTNDLNEVFLLLARLK